MKSFESISRRASVEAGEKWLDIIEEIPFLKFPDNCEIQIIPPYLGTVARFKVKRNDNIVSVALDYYDKLGHEGKPYYWIQFVNSRGTMLKEPLKFFLDEIDDMMKAIDELLS